MTKATIVILISQFLGAALMAPVVNAQTATGASGYGSAQPGVVTGSGLTIMMPMPPQPIMPPVDSGFLQFNNLTVESVSGTSLPAEILASNPNIYPVMGAPGAGMNAPSARSVPSTLPSAASPATCFKFDSQNSAVRRAVTCPTPPFVTAPTTQTAPSSTTSGNAASPMMYPIRYMPYRIEVDASTRLLLRDRTVGTPADFSPGDLINVFGYYNSDGSIQAYLVRDLSKPAVDEFFQLNNVEVASISANTIPATLVVTQSGGFPCYGFGSGGATMKQPIACPLGAGASANNPALQNLSVPTALAPSWQLLRKYVITIDARTILLDNNRTNISLSDIRIGDQLNIYGDTSDNGQTIRADIIRDLSIPATPSTFSGSVTQMNADGTFVVQTNDGRTVTVQNPIQVGAAMQLTGLLDRLTNVLTQVSNLSIAANGGATLPLQPAAAPGMIRAQGGINPLPAPLPAGH
jgi:Domain of unknown function (DUF5666)